MSYHLSFTADQSYMGHLQDCYQHILSQAPLKMALVVQGGGQRGIFTAGVLDAFLEAEFDPFQLYIGTSAGALNLSSYISRQLYFGRDFIVHYTLQDQFFNLYQYISQQKSLDLDWALSQVMPNGEMPLDFQQARAVLKYRQAFACATQRYTLKDRYLAMYQDDWFDVLKASCAIPILYNQLVRFNETDWLDGGISSAIPIREAWRQGADLVVVIRTEPIEHQTAPESPNFFTDWRDRLDMKVPWSLNNKAKEFRLSKLLSVSQHWDQWLRRRWVDVEAKPESMMVFTPTTPLSELNSPIIWMPHHAILQKLNEKKIKPEGMKQEIIKGESFKEMKRKSSEFFDILACYYQNNREINAFMLSPPKDLCVIQIAPEQSLQCRALLSQRADMDLDYMEGFTVGQYFIHGFQSILSEYSESCDDFCPKVKKDT